MMYGHEKSDSAIVATKLPNKSRPAGGGGGGAKGGDQGEHGPAKHAPDTDPGKRVPGAGPCAESRKASPPSTRGRSRMPESGSSGSVRGERGNPLSYRDHS
jgi:hypothetical protein